MIEALFTVQEFQEYLDFERNSIPTFLCQFSRNERLIFFCHYRLGWGYRRMRNKTGFPRRFFEAAIKKLREHDKRIFPERYLTA